MASVTMLGKRKRSQGRRNTFEEALGSPVDYKEIFSRANQSAKGPPTKKRKAIPKDHILCLRNGHLITCSTPVTDYSDLTFERKLAQEDESFFGPSQEFVRKKPAFFPGQYNSRRDPGMTAAELRLLPKLKESIWIRVFWFTQMSWFRAEVKELSPSMVVCYEDGEKEWLNSSSVFRIETDRIEHKGDRVAAMWRHVKLEKPPLPPKCFNANTWKTRCPKSIVNRKVQILNRSDYSWTCGTILDADHTCGYLYISVKCLRGKNSKQWIDPEINEVYILTDASKKAKRRSESSFNSAFVSSQRAFPTSDSAETDSDRKYASISRRDLPKSMLELSRPKPIYKPPPKENDKDKQSVGAIENRNADKPFQYKRPKKYKKKDSVAKKSKPKKMRKTQPRKRSTGNRPRAWSGKFEEPRKCKYLGVSWNTQHRKWIAQVGHRGQRIYVGQFDDCLEGAKAIDRCCIQLGIPPRNGTIPWPPKDWRPQDANAAEPARKKNSKTKLTFTNKVYLPQPGKSFKPAKKSKKMPKKKRKIQAILHDSDYSDSETEYSSNAE